MRMKELVQATGIPRTAIHHYQREGLLPPAAKTAPNAARYGPEHVERLKLIAGLRSEELGPFSLDAVREILAMVDAGVEPELAAALRALPGAVGAGAGEQPAGSRYALSEMAHEVGLSLAALRRLVRSGLVVGDGREEGARFGPDDARIARMIAALIEVDEVRIGDLEPVAELVAETVRYERALTDLATARLTPEEAAGRRHRMYRSLHALHTYLFMRHLEAPVDAAT